jgi:uncharacterized protein HemX
MEPLRTKGLQAQIDALESYKSNDAARKKRIVDAMKANLERSLADAAQKLGVRLERQVREAVELHSGGRGDWLASYIERVVRSAIPSTPAYREFEAHVLAAYRCRTTGRFPPSLTRPC